MNIFHKVLELWPGHESGTYGRTDGTDRGNTLCPSAILRIRGGIKMKEMSSLFITHCINVMHALIMFHEYIPYSLGVMDWTWLTIWNYFKGEIIQKPKMQELSSLFMTHRINAMHALIKFLEYIP